MLRDPITALASPAQSSNQPAEAVSRRPRKRRSFWARYGVSIVFTGTLVLILALWFLAVGVGVVSHLILPAPGEVAVAFATGVFQGAWLNDIYVTLQEAVLGFLAGAILAVVIGAVFAYMSTLRRGLYPFILAFQTFPKIAIAPLLLAWLGYGLAPKVIIAAMLAFFPVFSNTLAGFLEVDPAMVDLLRSMRASPLQELRYLRAPNAVAFIVPSFDVAMVLALLGAIAAELAGAAAGLGNVIQQRTFLGDTPAVYAVLILLAILGLGMKLVIGLATRRFRPAK
jgi:NitT/TauT family transport system permease protein